MKAALVPVDEKDTEFLSHPPRPLFPNVQDKIGDGISVQKDLIALENGDIFALEVDWLSAAFGFRAPLTINSGQIPSPQTNFPMLIKSTIPALADFNIAELAFAKDDNLPLNDYHLRAVNMATGFLLIWVKIPSLAVGENVNIYNDNPFSIVADTPEKLWSDFSSVYYFNNNGDDETANHNTAITSGITYTTGKIEQTAIFTSPAKIDITNYNVPFDFTISFWFKTSQTTLGDLLAIVNDAGDHLIIIEQRLDNKMRFLLRNPPSTSGGQDVFTTTDTNDGVSHMLHVGFNKTTGIQSIYLDGILEDTIANTQPMLTDAMIAVLGRLNPSSGDRHYEGRIEQFKMCNLPPDSDRILTEFNNQNSPTTFYSDGAKEFVPAPTDRIALEA